MSPDRSKLIFGCHNLTGGSSYWRSKRLVDCALDLGIRHFDVAPLYGLGTAEKTLARALGRRRLDPAIAITTKFGLAPPRFGVLAAWLREPYRALRGRGAVLGLGFPMLSAGGSGAPRAQGAFRQAVEASLRTMGLERIGTVLSHERLADGLADSYRDEAEAVAREGLIGAFGFSGELGNVQSMIEKTGLPTKVIQVSVVHHAAIPPVGESRFFNLGAVARRLLQDGPPAGLRDVLPRPEDMNEIGLAMAGVLAWARWRLPQSALILNASTPERLRGLVEASEAPGVADWAERHHDRVARAIEGMA
jgi:aryl-alcohol dehydrogenase-like predicted oxidoreductase